MLHNEKNHPQFHIPREYADPKYMQLEPKKQALALNICYAINTTVFDRTSIVFFWFRSIVWFCEYYDGFYLLYILCFGHSFLDGVVYASLNYLFGKHEG